MKGYRNIALAVFGMSLLAGLPARADDKEDLQKLLSEVGDLRKASGRERQEAAKPAQESKEMIEAFKTLAAEAVKEAQTRADQTKILQKQLDECRKELAKVRDQANDMKNKLSVAEIELQATKKNCQTFEKLVAELEKREPARVVVTGQPGAVEMPSDQHAAVVEKEVHGKVSGIADAGLYIVSIGADAGVKQGQILEVFRTEDKPKKIGAISVVRSYTNQAVGKFEPEGSERAKLGDDVTARVAP